ncbi:hypothetical protein PsorP6_013070 [Peronosclerospora sorghi]|uniref:Uncharacterized protein n=1 Tax=Peronosclerospora sorghi TaxID=230839 RepID=A0ACC0WHU4_9STRA|nr:hypothetical protein PsorP6_013070 [Peronosclerospora sorghi]
MHQLEVEIDMVAFKCVFGLLKLTSELSQAYDCAKQIYGVERNEKFMPHYLMSSCSFIYGDLPHEMRVKLANELRPRFDGKRLKYLSELHLNGWKFGFNLIV